MNIQNTTDIKELKAMKADQYDLKENLESRYAQTKQNIAVIGTRIDELESSQEKEKAAETEAKDKDDSSRRKN